MSEKRPFFKKDKKNAPIKSKITITVILSLLLCIPIAWALINAKLVDSKGFLGTPFSISLYDRSGNAIISDSAMVEYASPRSAVSIFNNILTNMQKENIGSVDPSTLGDPFTADINRSGLQEKYKFYFYEKDTCYCVDQNNQVYMILQQDANSFLNSSYSESIYASATPPQLITGNGEIIVPNYTNWNYRLQSGEFVKATQIDSSIETFVYDISGNLNIEFEIPPTECKLQIFRDDSLIFDGNYADIEDLTIDTGTRLKVYVLATWDYDSAVPYYGDVKYVFYADINNYADFSLSNNQINHNEFIVISGTNIEDVSKIKFTPILQSDTLMYIYDPVFKPEGNFVRAILPFPSNLEPGTYCFNLTYGAFSKDFTVELNAQNKDLKIYNSGVPFSNIYNMSSIDTQTDFINAVKSVPTDIAKNIYLSPNLTNPIDLGLTCEYKFGNLVSCSDGSFAYSALGNRYSKEGESNFSVSAANNGKVVCVGHCAYLGNFVVIDHGLGFKTWYANLSSINVVVGDYVKCGEQVGRSGTHSSSLSDGYLLMCSYNDIFMDSEYCITNGILNELGAKSN